MRKLKITELHRLTPEQYRASRKQPLIVVLDHVRSLNNVGSIFRTADAFRLEALYLCGVTSTPPHPEIRKTALGAEDAVEWLYFADTRDAVRRLKDDGYTVCVLEQAEGSITPDCFMPENDKKYALVLGHEVKGVQQEVVDMADCCIEIPQFGTKHSLNVAVAAGIAIWEFAGKHKNKIAGFSGSHDV
ncbi:MAG: RNA methyltransferase [Tannerella sp.]|jgi:tRNA G18 (ribose-2'-O)-methylase SpoU|nr:RNA methyltransferase [Tannerella sp.]